MYNLKYMLMKAIALSNKSLGCSNLQLCRSCVESNVPFKSNQMPSYYSIATRFLYTIIGLRFITKAVDDLLTASSNSNYERTTGQLTIWLTVNDCDNRKIETLGLLDRRPIISRLIKSKKEIDLSVQQPEFNTINWRDTNHFYSEDDFPQFVEAAVTVNNNSPIPDYVHPDDHTQPTYEMTPGFKPCTDKQ